MRVWPAAPPGRVVAVLLLLTAVAVGVPAAGGPGTACPAAPAGVSGGGLSAVATTPQQTAWAAGWTGHYPGHVVTLIEHWDGTTWTRVPSPSPVGRSYLFGVAATSDSDAWTVGNTGSNDRTHSLIDHWDGTAWKIVPSPNLASGVSLDGVATTSARNAWAVGATVNVNGHDRAVIEHWDGTAWRLVPSPSPGGVTGAPQLYAIAAASASDAWAVGGYHRSVYDYGSTLIEHWNGRAWRQVPSPSPARGFSLYGVAASSARDAWAVGYSSTTNDTVIEHWNGRTWRVAANPTTVYGGTLDSVTVAPSGGAWAVGGTGVDNPAGGGEGRTMIARGNGGDWTKVPSPSPGGDSGDGVLSGVAATTTGGDWAVGMYLSAKGAPRTLIECWNGTAWTG